MVEKKFVVYELRITYTGPVKIVDFYKEVEDWMKNKGFNKELKKKTERLTPKGKQIDWTIEMWKNITTFAKEIVRLRAAISNVKEIEIKRRSKRLKTQHAEIFLIIDGILETYLSQRWEQTPWFYFIRAMIDKYIWNFWWLKNDPIVSADTFDFHKNMRAFFNLQKIKYR